MNDAFSKITAILLCIFMMFIIPVFYMTEEADRLKQTRILEEITGFVDGIRNTGILSKEDYSRLEKVLYSLGGGYRIELTHSFRSYDENGEEVRYFTDKNYTAQILDKFMQNKDYFLSKNDYLRIVIWSSKNNVVAWYGGSVKYEAY